MEINKEKLESFRGLYSENARRFALRIGVSYQWYYDFLEAERINPRLETIQTIADALGIPAKDLIK